MKFLGRFLFAGLIVFALSTVAVFGKDKTRTGTVSFSNDVTVAGTPVKAGEYKVKFDEATSQLSIMKGGKVVVTTTASLQDRSQKAASTTMFFRDNQLVSIAFGGDHQDIVVGQANSTTGSEL